MKILDMARYAVAVMVAATFPPAVLLWVAIHPFASFWRRLGPGWTYGILGVPVAGYMASAWIFRRFLLGRDLGTSAPNLVLAAAFFAAAWLLLRARRRHLNFGRLSGMPELSSKLYPGQLLTAGVYGRIRHPRYVEVFFLELSYVLFANHAGLYLLAALTLPLMCLVVLLEERELSRRFGTAYEEYRRRVPRFFPRRKAAAPEKG